MGQATQIQNHPTHEHLYAELWVSLASLLQSYTAVHGLHANLQATIELSNEKIIVHHRKNRLTLHRQGAQVAWTRENGMRGTLLLIEHGRLRGPEGEQELDMAAEAWARDLMHSHEPEHPREPKP